MRILDASCQPATEPSHGKSLCVHSSILWKNLQAGLQPHSSALAIHCRAVTAQGFGNNFIQHRDEGITSFISPQSLLPITASAGCHCPEIWSWTGSCICFLICFSQNLATAATEITPADFASAHSKTMMPTAKGINQHRRRGPANADRNTHLPACLFVLKKPSQVPP